MKRPFLALSILTILLYACKNDDVINAPELTSTQACQDNLTAESIFADVGRIVEEGLQDNGQNKSFPVYSLMNTDTSDVDTLIINFGPEAIFFPNPGGKMRKGKINITYTGRYRDSLSIITTTFDNYYVNDNLVQGERVVTNQGRNNDGNIWFKIEINNVSIATPNGTINWESNRIREWVGGESTYLDITDDVYRITGTASGNGLNGNDFTMTITDDLNIDLGCLPYCVLKSGTAKISPTGYSDRIINYGDSLCDCNVNVIINGNTYPIVIGS